MLARMFSLLANRLTLGIQTPTFICRSPSYPAHKADDSAPRHQVSGREAPCPPSRGRHAAPDRPEAQQNAGSPISGEPASVAGRGTAVLHLGLLGALPIRLDSVADRWCGRIASAPRASASRTP